MNTKTYLELMAEAKAEFDAWDAEAKFSGIDGFIKKFAPRVKICKCGNKTTRKNMCFTCVVKRRAETREPCECGKPYFARGKCRRCYYLEYNRRRIRDKH